MSENEFALMKLQLSKSSKNHKCILPRIIILFSTVIQHQRQQAVGQTEAQKLSELMEQKVKMVKACQ